MARTVLKSKCSCLRCKTKGTYTPPPPPRRENGADPDLKINKLQTAERCNPDPRLRLSICFAGSTWFKPADLVIIFIVYEG